MRRPECQPWIEISDRDALGEFVSSEERRFLQTHEAGCKACAQEAAVWDSIGATAVAPIFDAQALEKILLEARAIPPSDHRVLPNRRWAASPRKVAAGIAAACAMAAALFLVIRRDAPPSPTSSVVESLPLPATLSDPAVVAEPVPLAPTSEARVVAGTTPTCRVMAPGVTACLAAGTEVTTARLAPPRRLLDLVRGRVVVSLTPQPPGTSFGVATAAGIVTAVGTVFSVEVTATGDTVARVERGEVLVQGAGGGTEQRLDAGEQLRLGDKHAAAPLAPQEKKRDLSILAYREDRAGPRGEKAAEPTERDERVAARGEKLAEAAQGSAETQSVTGSTPPSVAPPAAPGSAIARGTATGETLSSARQLLGRARALRTEGAFREAAEVYRAAHSANPQSAEGRAALVSLGGLLLSELNEPAGALQAFDTYLSERKGDLAQEAEYGKIRALRALGRHDAEKSAIQSFLGVHPDGPEAQVLRRRLEAMSKK